MVNDLRNIIKDSMREFVEMSKEYRSSGIMVDSESWGVEDNSAVTTYFNKASEVYGLLKAYTQICDDGFYDEVEKEFRLRMDRLQVHVTDIMNRDKPNQGHVFWECLITDGVRGVMENKGQYLLEGL